jgi:hypothetical protein
VSVFSRRRPEPPDEQAEDHTQAVQAGHLVLQTFENRRTQLTARSTICATAASGVIVLVIQIFLANPSTRLPVRVLGMFTLSCAALALLAGLSVIKKLSRRTRATRSREHLLFFGTFVALSADEAYERITNVTDEVYLRELAIQAVELSRNLRRRYDALGKAYLWLSTSVVAFVLTLLAQQGYLIFSP